MPTVKNEVAIPVVNPLETIESQNGNSGNGDHSEELITTRKAKPPKALLDAEHIEQLEQGSRIAPEVIAARGYRTIQNPDVLATFGFQGEQLNAPGLLMPYFPPGDRDAHYIYKPDTPRRKPRKQGEDAHKVTYIKYEGIVGSGLRIDVHPFMREYVKDPRRRLWITEGIKKGDALVSASMALPEDERFAVVTLLGVSAFKGKNEFGGKTFLADFDYIAWEDRTVNIAYDSDVMTKPQVQAALDKLTEHLERKHATVMHIYLSQDGEEKVGVDDYLKAGGTYEMLCQLAQIPATRREPLPPVVVWLDVAPERISRPLTVIGGQGYAAIFPHFQMQYRETIDKKGQIITHDPPLIKTEQIMHIVRSDGVVFGPGGDVGLDALGYEITLPEIIENNKAWSKKGVSKYREGYRPDVASVFNRICDIIDQFLDFNKSLTDQRGMAELISCYIIATWFLDSFNVIGFLWTNGEKGSGKSQVLNLVAEMGYLGQVITAGATFATLRDMADYGATLCFDDAENIANEKGADPDKRAFMLAGNTRSTRIPVKEQATDGGKWRTRYVNAFCARAFSAIRRPDSVLASRTIVIPLVRTSNTTKANANPLQIEKWRHSRQELIDDLWAMAVHHLPTMGAYENAIGDEAPLSGRTLEPFWALLSVARWLDEQGVEGLYKRMVALSIAYQKERTELESADINTLIVRALCKTSGYDLAEVKAGETERTFFTVHTAALTDTVKAIAVEMEADIEEQHITSKRIGRSLGRMRFQHVKENGTGARCWKVSMKDLRGWIESLSIKEIEDEVVRQDLMPNEDDIPF